MNGVMQEAIREAVERYIEETREYTREAVETCTNCGLCLAACTVYSATGDPRLSPPRRLRAALKVLEGGRPSGDDMLSLFTCNLCGACTYACPYGIEVLRSVHAARILLSKKGVEPPSLRRIEEAASRSGHSFLADRGDAERRLVEAARAAGLEPDSPCDALYAPTPFDTTLYPRILPSVVQLLRLAGLTPGVSRRVLDAGGNVAVDGNNLELGLSMLLSAVEEAERLGARLVVLGPCGSDWKLAILARKLGVLRENRVRVLNVYEVLAERGVRASCGGCALFTSCTYARLDASRSVLRVYRARVPRDRPPYTRCCGGAGGLNYLHEEPYASIRRRVAKWRFERLVRDTGGRPVAIPCAKCYTILRQGALLAKKPTYPLHLLPVKLAEELGSASQPSPHRLGNNSRSS